MKSSPVINPAGCKAFPSFAAFLLGSCLDELSLRQLELVRMMNVPIFKYFEGQPEEVLLSVSKRSLEEFLRRIAENDIQKHLAESLQKWKANNLPYLKKNEISIEDISSFHHLRKKLFHEFIPSYTNDISLAMLLVEEIDSYYVFLETASVSTFINLQKERINENLHFISKITNTIPAIVYVFDLVKFKPVFSTPRFYEKLGYTSIDVEQMGNSLLREIVYADDFSAIEDIVQKIEHATDGELLHIECRVKDSSGRYQWYRSFVSIFKRDENNKVKQVIGIAFDVEEEREIAEKLQARENQLLEAQELAQMGSFEWDLVTGKTELTPELEKVLAMKEGDLLEDFILRVHPADREKVQQEIDLSMKTGLFECEFRYLPGSREKIVWSKGKVEFLNGQPVVMKGNVMDVTERNHIIKRLQRSDELYKQAQAIAHLGNWVWELDSDRMIWTDEMYRIFGMDAGVKTINHETVEKYIHPDDDVSRNAAIGYSIRSLEPLDIYYRIVMDDGRMKTVHARGEVLSDEDGIPLKMIGTLQDVSEQKMTEQKLRENQIFIQKIADSAPIIITAWNVKNSRFTFVSQGCKKLLGCDPAEILQGGMGYFEQLIHPDDLTPLRLKSAEALQLANQPAEQDKNDIIIDAQYRMRHRSGVYRWFHSFGTVLERNKFGEVEQVLNISLDITGRVEAEQKIVQKTLELQQSNASLEEFAHVASHDLKEPLRKISTFGDRLYMLLNENVHADGRLYLQKIIDSSRRMQNLIDDLLSVSVISSEKAFVRHSLETILEEVLCSLEYKIEEQRAEIEVDVKEKVLMIPSQFRQLFQNLISNSLKFTKRGIASRISIRSLPLKPWQIGSHKLRKSARYLRIDIVDNGIGFREQFSDQIFSIFQRLHPRSVYEGTGIGLAICKKIVEHHGGVIFAKGKEDEGAVFTMIIPYE